MESNLNLEEICNRYKVDKVLDIKPQSSGHVNDTYIVKTAECDYVLQRVQKGMHISHLEHNYSLYSEVLDKCGLVYPKWMKDCDGKHFYIDQETDAWRMYPYIESDMTKEPLSGEMLYAYGEGIAKMHAAFREIDGEVEPVYPHLHDLAFYLQKHRRLITSDSSQKSFRDSELEKQIELLGERFGDISEECQDIIHSDTKLSNVLFKEGQVLGFIDFDTITKGPVTIDIADAIRSCCIKDGKLDKEAADCLINGYTDLCDAGIAEEVKNNLQRDFEKICFELALRYYIDAISGENYFKDKEPAYKLERAKSLIESII